MLWLSALVALSHAVKDKSHSASGKDVVVRCGDHGVEGKQVNNQKSSQWSTNDANKKHIQELRKSIDMHGRHNEHFRVGLGSSWIIPAPDGSMSDEFSRDPHVLKGYGAWLPEVFFPHLCNGAPCPNCKTDTNIRVSRWTQKGPRKVCTWQSYWWLDTKVVSLHYL